MQHTHGPCSASIQRRSMLVAMHGSCVHAPTACAGNRRRRACSCSASSAPSLTDSASDSIPIERSVVKARRLPPRPPQRDGGLTFKGAVRLAEKKLSNLKLAIGEMALLAVLCAVGTVIDQDQTPQWYMQNFPDGSDGKVLGFLDYKLLYALELDHIYTSTYFLGVATLLAASLVACSRTQQWPLLKMAKKWKFPKKPAHVFMKGQGETLPNASVRDLGRELARRRYNVFVRDGALYAFKGIAGRFAPIAVHVSLLAILGGGAFGALAGFDGQVMVPEGSEFLVADVLRGAGTAIPGVPLPAGASRVVRLDKFIIEYRSDGSIGQYRSVMSERDLDGNTLRQKEIFVNEPLRFGGVTLYQTDWGLAAFKLKIGTDPGQLSQPINVPVAELSGALGLASSAESKLYGAFLPLELPSGDKAPKVLARDLQQVVFYDSDGQFIGVRRPGSGKPQEVEGQWFVVDEIVGASGVQLKHDPGTAIVYAGFGLLMITAIVSYMSHSQVWALQEGPNVHVGGKTNRAQVGFSFEFDKLLEAVPDTGAAQS